MKIFIMRHAQASFNAPSDNERPITESGINQTKSLLLSSGKELSNINQIWCSHLLRARQTASLASEVLRVDVQEKVFLTPDGNVREVIGELQSLGNEDCLLIVSHQPLVGELVSALVHGSIRQAHPYTTSEVIELEMDVLGLGTATLIKQYLPST